MNPTFLDYQARARETAIYGPSISNMLAMSDTPSLQILFELLYVSVGMCGEVGEFCNKVKKVLRDFKGEITPEVYSSLVKELGDVLWYWSECCTALGARTSDVAESNIAGLRDREERGVLSGDGDNR